MGRTSDARERLLEAAIDLIWRSSYGSVSVDDICAQAGVKKGSFYHFFKSKDDLVVAAVQHHWAMMRPEFDRIFSATVPPLERLRLAMEHVYTEQVAVKERTGFVPGCPFASIGCETSSHQSIICATVQDICSGHRRYLEALIRDAQALGQIKGGDPAELAEALYAYIEGVMTQARIQNDPQIIQLMYRGSLKFLGAEPPAPGTLAPAPGNAIPAAGRARAVSA